MIKIIFAFIVATVWLDEGLASLEGSPHGHESYCPMAFQKAPPFHFDELEKLYHKIPAADVYSYTAVRFIIDKFGFEKLNQLIKSPMGFEKILLMTRNEFNKDWNGFIENRYKKEG